jgi:hypothetical protein
LFDSNVNPELSSTLVFKNIEDKYKKINLVEELFLRCFNFEQDKKIFDFEPFDGAFVFTEENSEKYKKINFKKFGINDLVFKYSVNDDHFFNYIPIKKILNNGKNVNLDDLKNHLTECGFELREYSPYIESIPMKHIDM